MHVKYKENTQFTQHSLELLHEAHFFASLCAMAVPAIAMRVLRHQIVCLLFRVALVHLLQVERKISPNPKPLFLQCTLLEALRHNFQ